MFSINPNPTFTATVSGFVPGKPQEGLKVTFRFRTPEQHIEWEKQNKERPLKESIEELIETWEDAPVPFAPGAVATVAATYGAFPQALYSEYVSQLFQVQRKN